MLYQNISCSVKTFYGVEFKPGEVKEVPGYINNRKMIVVDKSEEISTQSKPSSEKQKKASAKSAVISEDSSPSKPVEAEEHSQDSNNDNKTDTSKA